MYGACSPMNEYWAAAGVENLTCTVKASRVGRTMNDELNETTVQIAEELWRTRLLVSRPSYRCGCQFTCAMLISLKRKCTGKRMEANRANPVWYAWFI